MTSELERQLEQLTEWNEPTGEQWRGALERAAEVPAPAPRRLTRIGVYGSIAAVILIGATVYLSMVASPSNSLVDPEAPLLSSPPSRRPPEQANLRELGAASSIYASEWRGQPFSLDLGDGAAGGPAAKALPPPSLERQVAQKATVELETDDVRGTFARVLHLVSEAAGEYVESSSLTGEVPTMLGELRIRVARTRLSSVLAQLHDLGTVTAEALSGEDVTDRLVDIEAHIANERRVEQELLELLQSRQNADLREILDLRRHLAEVRGSIERAEAGRARLGRLVELASVLVIVRAMPVEKSDEPETHSELGEYFMDSVSSAWVDGLRTLVRSLAFALRITAGGLIWWALLIVVILAALRRRPARLAEAA